MSNGNGYTTPGAQSRQTQTQQTQHVHWKRAFNPDWLGGWCLPDGKDIVLTIRSAGQELVTGEKGKQEMCLVLHWVEDARPMICNRTNAKSIQRLVGSPYMDDWVGHKVQIYYDPSVKFGGECVGGLRIRKSVTIQPAPASAPAPARCEMCGAVIQDAGGWSTAKIIAAGRKKYGKALCWDCVSKIAKEVEQDEQQTGADAGAEPGAQSVAETPASD